jgi:hypothetical protein
MSVENKGQKGIKQIHQYLKTNVCRVWTKSYIFHIWNNIKNIPLFNFRILHFLTLAVIKSINLRTSHAPFRAQVLVTFDGDDDPVGRVYNCNTIDIGIVLNLLFSIHIVKSCSRFLI